MTKIAELDPFDDIRALAASLPGPDDAAAAQAEARNGQLTKPAGSLGRLEEIASWMSAWQGKHPASAAKPMMAVFASNHGVTAQGVSAYPMEVTAQMVANFSAGGAAINQLCGVYGIGLQVFELALEQPTPDISVEPAFSERDCAATIGFGMEAIASGTDLLCLGEMGIGNTTIAAAIYHGLYGGQAEDWVGRGTGVDDEGLKHKANIVARAVALNGGRFDDPLEVLRRLGGREVAAMVGAILAARTQRIPVVLDGYIACAAAAIVHALEPSGLDHCLAAHVSAESAHGEVLQRLGKKPLFDFGMRLGEGSGAALAVGVIKAALAAHNGMATFADAGVSGPG